MKYRVVVTENAKRVLPSNREPLMDPLGRVHTELRISVTDRCNNRCVYCMPDEKVRFKRREELLTFEEIERFVRIVAAMGIRQLRITGGEPLVRAGLPKLIAALAAIPGIDDMAMTTNGVLLAECAQALKDAGLHRLNISLDAMGEERFRRITRRDDLDRVLAGITAAQQAGFRRIRLNAVAIRGLTDDEVVPLARFARDQGLELRFIEYMPLDAGKTWHDDQVLSGEEILARLAAAFGPLLPTERPDPSQPAVDFSFADGIGRVGFISPMSHPFCGDCNRLRITADGRLRNCLFAAEEWDARAVLRTGGTDDDLATLVRTCVGAKKFARGNDESTVSRPARAMYQIGG